MITISQRRGAGDHLLATAATLDHLGIDVQTTDRGGGITYHGPGQLVVYPIVRLEPLALNIGRYMRLLERSVIDTVEAFGVEARRLHGLTGVWVEGSGCGAKKLCAMGVRVRKNVTLHGLALNVDPDLDHFATIVPCGLAGYGVTSLHALLGQRCPTMTQVKEEIVAGLRRRLEAAAKACFGIRG